MGVHLVAFAVAKGGGGTGSGAEGAVKSGSILGGIGHNGHILEACRIQRAADGSHAAVHHVGGCHHVGACLGMGKSGFAQ